MTLLDLLQPKCTRKYTHSVMKQLPLHLIATPIRIQSAECKNQSNYIRIYLLYRRIYIPCLCLPYTVISTSLISRSRILLYVMLTSNVRNTAYKCACSLKKHVTIQLLLSKYDISWMYAQLYIRVYKYFIIVERTFSRCYCSFSKANIIALISRFPSHQNARILRIIAEIRSVVFNVLQICATLVTPRSSFYY